MSTVTLIALRFGADRGAMPPLGCLILAELLRRHGHVAEVVDSGVIEGFGPYSLKHLADAIERATGDIVALSIFNDAIPLVVLTLEHFPECLKGRRLLIGGPGVTGLERELLERIPQAEAVVRGDGESALLYLLRRRSVSLVPPKGVYIRLAGGAIVGEGLSDREDMSAVPRPAWDLSPRSETYKQLPISTMRGCPFDCSFCDVIASFGRRVSRRPLGMVEGDIIAGTQVLGLRMVRLVDDTFNISRPHMHEFCNRFSGLGPGYSFTAYARLELLNQSDLDRLADAGCHRLFIGVDALDEDSHTPLSKGYTARKVRDTIRAIMSRGIGVAMSMIWGFPDESLEVFLRGLRLAEELFEEDDDGLFWPQYGLLSPSVATPVYERHAVSLLDVDLDAPSHFSSFYTLGQDMQHSSEQFVPEVLRFIRGEPRLAAPFRRFATPDFELKRESVLSLRRRVESGHYDSYTRAYHSCRQAEAGPEAVGSPSLASPRLAARASQ